MARSGFLRSTAAAALAGIAGSGLLAASASAQTVGTISPSRVQGKTLVYPLPAQRGRSNRHRQRRHYRAVKNAVYALSITCPHRAVTALDWNSSTRSSTVPGTAQTFKRMVSSLTAGRIARWIVSRSAAPPARLRSIPANLLQQDSAQDAWIHAFVTVAINVTWGA